MADKKIFLPESEMPTHWYNIAADLKNPPPPPLHPATHQPIGPEALAPLFPMELIKQEVTTERYIPIPEEVQEIYKIWRPAPLIRATALEKALDTPAKIYYKYEGVSPSGSHKPNTAVPQAYYNMKEGVKRIATETGAGQWGSSLAFACQQFGIESKVYMVRVSYEQKPYRRSLMQLWGGSVVPSPSNETNAGRAILEQDPQSSGSLGIAISEAVEDAAMREDTKYSLGSVLNHVLLHQTVIGQEAIKQMEIAGDYPDVVVGCAGGGSNAAGLMFPFLKAKIESRTFHLIILDEAQGSADQIVAKSLGPMLAYNAGTLVKTGTPATQKNNFYQTIQRNKRRQTGRGVKQNHFEWDWREVAKVNPNYGKFVKKEMLRIGEDSDEFQMSYCTVPETRILTADMRHIPAGDITVGMKLVGFDEERPGKGQHRRLQESVVEDVGRIMRPCYRLTLSDGTSITCSSEHRWLVTTAGRRTEWKMAKDLVSTDRIFKVTDVWEHTEDYRTGYLAAAFEGEGHFSRHSMLGFSQRDNPMMLKVRKYLEELNFSTWEVTGSGTNEDVTVLHVGGGRSEVMRFLGQVRPERLLDKVDVGQFGTIGRHYKEPDQFQHPYVLNSEFVGEREVVAIKTSTKTYIAEGLASHNCVRWILERGMFVTEGVMEQLSDRSMEVVKHWHKSPVVVGIDPARKLDSTVVTVVWVDWDRPDEFGYYDHRVLNWLELQGEDWEQQYAEITDFLANYDVLAVAVDANGVGDAVAQRLKLLLPRAEVIPVTSSMSEQSARFKHLQALIQRKMIGFPGHAKTRRLRVWKRFMQQMIDAERHYQGANFTVKAPEEAWAHDDHVDALAIACSLTKEYVMPTIEVSASPFFG